MYGFAQNLNDPLSQLDISPILQMRRLRPGYWESPSGQDTQLVSEQARMPFNLVVFSGQPRLKWLPSTGLPLAVCALPDFLCCLMLRTWYWGDGRLGNLKSRPLVSRVECINSISITSSHLSHFPQVKGLRIATSIWGIT